MSPKDAIIYLHFTSQIEIGEKHGYFQKGTSSKLNTASKEKHKCFAKQLEKKNKPQTKQAQNQTPKRKHTQKILNQTQTKKIKTKHLHPP